MERLYKENILREIINVAMDAFIVIDSNNIVTEWNPQAETLFGWTHDEAVGQPISSLIIPHELRQEHDAGVKNYAKDSAKLTSKRLELPAITKNGDQLTIELTVAPVEIDGGMYFGAVIRDLSREKRERVNYIALANDLKRKAYLLDLTRDGIYVVNRQHQLVMWNRGAQELYGYTEEEALGKVSYKLLETVFDSGTRSFIDIVKVLMETGKWEGELGQTTKDGRKITVLSRWAVDNEKEEVLITNTDITQLKANTDRAEYLATHDDLTGLPNRRLLDDRVRHAITQARRHGTKFAIMLLDLDRFKVINDSMGHHQGDILLKEVSQRLLATVREEDTVARHGGDEFVILLENITNVDKVSEIATKIIQAITKPFDLDNQKIRVDTSIGISIFPTDGEDNNTLTRHADLAMYRAKDVDKGSFRFFSTEMNDAVQQRLQNEHELRRALENDEFILYYQPKICCCQSGSDVGYRTTGAEALIRWNHPTRGLVSPVEFIPLAEEIGLIGAIGEWVLKKACWQNRQWQKQGKAPIQISVNLSIHQLTHGIVRVIKETLEETGLDPKYLDLEITESAAMDNVDHTIETLQQIRNLGVSLSIDDFGTGYSSLAHLKKMPINNLKIDQSFVRGIPLDNDDICIVRSIIVMAHSMNLKVIAEGVNDPEQVAFLDTMQCDEMQGFLFSEPCVENQLKDEMIGMYWDFPYAPVEDEKAEQKC